MPLSLVFTCLTLILLPAYVVRFQFGPVPSTLLEVAILATVTVWVFEVLRRGKVGEVVSLARHRIFLLGLALTAVALLQVWVGPDLHALGVWRAFFLEPLALGLIVADLARRGWVKPLLLSLVGSGIWVAAIAIAQINFHLLTEINDRSALQILWGRAVSVYYTGNAVALFLGPIIILAAALSWKRKPWIIPAVVGLLVALLESRSRGGLGGVVTGVLAAGLGGVISQIRSGSLGVYWRVLAALPAIFAAVFGLLLLNITSLAANQESLGVLRFCVWDGALRVIGQNPILGAGLSGFGPAYSLLHTCNSEDLIYPHNLFLNFWSETGLLGMLLIVVLLTLIFRELARGRDRLLAFGLAGAVLYLLVHGLVDVPYFKNDLAAEFWVLAGLAVAISSEKFKFN